MSSSISNRPVATHIRALLDRFRRPRTRALVKKLLAAYLGYCAFTVLIGQPLLNHYAGKLYQAQTGRALQYDLVSFNPLTLALSITNSRDLNPDTSVFWQADRLVVDLSLWRSLFNLAPGLDAIDLSGVQLHLARDAQGQFNFADILEHQANLNRVSHETDTDTDTDTNPNTVEDSTAELASGEANPAATALPRFFIHALNVNIRAFSYRESRAAGNFTQQLQHINFQLNDFAPHARRQQDYAFSAQFGESANLSWQGDMSLRQQLSQGEFTVTQLPLQPISDYLAEALPLTVASGNFSLAGRYHIDWSQSLNWSLEHLHAQLDALVLKSRDPKDLNFALGHASLSDATVSSADNLLSAEKLEIQGLQLASWSQGDEIGFLRALNLNPSGAPSEPIGNTQDENSAAQASQPLQVFLKQLTIAKSDIAWTLADFDNAHLALTGITLDAQDLDLTGAETAQFTLQANAGTPVNQGLISATGAIDLAALNGEINLEIAALPLALANPFIASVIAGEIEQGRLNTRAVITLAKAAPAHVQLQGNIESFLLKPKNLTEEAVRFKSLRWDDTRVDFTQQQLDAGKLTLTGLDGRFVITQAGTTNLDALLINKPSGASNNTPAAEGARSASNAQDTWIISLDGMSLEDAAFRFHDASLTPKFVAAVQNFSGNLGPLVSNQTTPAQFSFAGNVDGYAPVTLKGQTQPFLNDPLVNAKLSFAHLDLGGLSSYSSTYAGWRIDRGQLSADLDYHLADNRIRGDNRVVMDKLQLGERVRSAQAMDIPLRLALAMITDSRGRAELNIGVSGDLDEPSFHLGAIIRDALKNTITRLVTAPFSFLAGLAGSDEDLGVLPFNSGSSKILATANRRLHALEVALKQRPELRIELIGRTDPISDTRGLQMLYAKEALLAEGLTDADLKAKNERWEKTLKNLYRRIPEKRLGDLTSDEIYEDWLTTFRVEPQALSALALNRATVSKAFLVQNLQLDPTRVFINAAPNCTEKDPSECRRRIAKIELTDRWDL